MEIVLGALALYGTPVCLISSSPDRIWAMRQRDTATQLVCYTACGLINSSVSDSVFLALYRGVGVHYASAAGLGYCAGMANSFWLNRAFTFQATGALRPMLVRFALVTGVGISVNLLVLHTLVTGIRLSPEIAQGLALLCAGCLNFAANKCWTFRPALEPAPSDDIGRYDPARDLFETSPTRGGRLP